MVGVDVGHDLGDPAPGELVEQQARRGGRMAPALPGDADHPRDLGGPARDGHGGLHVADGFPGVVEYHQVVEPRLAAVVGVAAGMDGVLAGEALPGGRLAARERVQGRIREDDDHLVGVVRAEGAQVDRGSHGPHGIGSACGCQHRPGGSAGAPASSPAPWAPWQR